MSVVWRRDRVSGEAIAKELGARFVPRWEDAVEAPDVEFGVVNGFSLEGATRYDLEPGRRLIDYEPEDDFETALAAHLARER